jgi:hypothetical protein
VGKAIRQLLKVLPKTEKSFIKISMEFSIISEKIENIHLWKVAGAFHIPKGILR